MSVKINLLKTLFIICVLFSFSSNLFSEQIDMFKDWIYPEDYEIKGWKRLPKKDGQVFYQFPENDNEKSLITRTLIPAYEISHIDVPKWFKENNLFTWDMTYSEFLENLKQNPKFYYYNSADYLLGYERECTFRYVGKVYRYVNVIYRSQQDYLLTFFFDLNASDKCVAFQFRTKYDGSWSLPGYRGNSLASSWKSQNYYLRMSLAFSAPLFVKKGIYPLSFDGRTGLSGYKTISDTIVYSDITSKEDLIKSLDMSGKSLWCNIYEQFKKITEEIPLEKLFDYCDANNFDFEDTLQILYVYDRKNVIGKHGIKAYNQACNIQKIRYAVAENIISYEEGLELVEPIVDDIVNCYSSYEDFFAHFISGITFVNLNTKDYRQTESDYINTYSNIYDYISLNEVEFKVNDADVSMTLENCFYGINVHKNECFLSYENDLCKPSEISRDLFSLVLMKADGLSIADVESIYDVCEKYGHNKVLLNFKNDIFLAKAGDIDNKNPKDFFDRKYKTVWNKISETEKSAIAFSSNLFQLNNMFPLDFENHIRFSKNDSLGKNLLHNSWEINCKEDLLKTIDDFSKENGGQAGAYRKYVTLLEKYPEKSPIDIGIEENLEPIDISRLFFAKEMNSKLGPHGIEAWDEGRMITIIRWALGADYIDYATAINLVTPYIEKIKTDYISWEDYISHYIAGRCFYGLYESDYEELYDKAVKAEKKAWAYIPFDEIEFTGENAAPDYVLKIEDAKYISCLEAKKWERALPLDSMKDYNKLLSEIDILEVDFPSVPCLKFLKLISYINLNKSYNEIAELVENEVFPSFVKNENNKMYNMTAYYYIQVLNLNNQPKYAILFFDVLPPQLKQDIDFKYQEAKAYYLLAISTSESEEKDYFVRTAIEKLGHLKAENYRLSQEIYLWLTTQEKILN